MTIFHNCLIKAPDGACLSRCSLKKLNWYIKNGLADQIEEDPPTIRLKFEPSGRWLADDPFFLEIKPNCCIVCGCVDNLTRHHIIPYCFIRHMDLKFKVDIVRDILPMCRDCHDVYELFSADRKKEMAKQYSIPINGLEEPEMGRFRRATRAANALYKHGNKIPKVRHDYLLNIIKKYLKKDEPNQDDIRQLSLLSVKDHADYVNFSQHICNMNLDYNEFAKEWRKHFVECMNPEHMPKNWSVDRITREDVWIPKRMKRNNKC